jgi:hypothetical protein
MTSATALCDLKALASWRGCCRFVSPSSDPTSPPADKLLKLFSLISEAIYLIQSKKRRVTIPSPCRSRQVKLRATTVPTPIMADSHLPSTPNNHINLLHQIAMDTGQHRRAPMRNTRSTRHSESKSQSTMTCGRASWCVKHQNSIPLVQHADRILSSLFSSSWATQPYLVLPSTAMRRPEPFKAEGSTTETIPSACRPTPSFSSP